WVELLLLSPRSAAANEHVRGAAGTMVRFTRRLVRVAGHPVGRRRAHDEHAAREIHGMTEVVAGPTVVREQLLTFDARSLAACVDVRRTLAGVVARRGDCDAAAIDRDALAEAIALRRIGCREARDASERAVRVHVKRVDGIAGRVARTDDDGVPVPIQIA